MKDTRLFLCARFAPSLRLRLEKRSTAQIPLKHPSFAPKLRFFSRKARLRRWRRGFESMLSSHHGRSGGDRPQRNDGDRPHAVGTDPRGTVGTDPRGSGNGGDRPQRILSKNAAAMPGTLPGIADRSARIRTGTGPRGRSRHPRRGLSCCRRDRTCPCRPCRRTRRRASANPSRTTRRVRRSSRGC